uniref:G-protein coupled receptors family 1 profile domain-containing protein n=1 Tax=Biomphalaria glabrata TaxID=6526 RepID=A0A2C9KBK2_BIOGL
MQKTIQVIMPLDNSYHWNNVSYDPHQYSRQNDHQIRDQDGGVQPSEAAEVSTSVTMLKNETEYKVAEIIWQVCPVLLFIFGTLGNVLIIMMMRTLRLGRTSMHIYLRALAISDMCVLYSGLLRQWIFYTFDVDLRNLNDIVCKIHTWMVYVSIYSSAWLLVVMTLERTCSACLPHRVSTFCTKRRAFIVILFIVLFQAVMQGHFLVGLSVSVSDDGKNETACRPCYGRYDSFVHSIYPVIDMVLLSLLPFIFVIVGNAVIVWKTFLSLKTAAELNLTSGKNALLRRRRASSMTIILLGLSAIFLLTTSPTCVYNIWELSGGLEKIKNSSKLASKAELAWALVNIIMYCNNTFNFYLYCLSGRKFRNELHRQFSKRRTDSQSNAMSAPSIQIHRFHQNDSKSKSLPEHQNGLTRQLSYQSSIYGRTSNAYL